jgi:hypothetical protein
VSGRRKNTKSNRGTKGLAAKPQHQVTRVNHYVPQWYQRGFLTKGQHKLHVLDLHPGTITLADGRVVPTPEINVVGPKQAFMQVDLYTTVWGDEVNDEIERLLFGGVDKLGADATRAWVSGDLMKTRRTFEDFFTYLDAQKLRTPKGLDWILKQYNGLPHWQLMLQMQALRLMHATMWSECVREIVSASKSSTKFLVSDHPVTVYHPQMPPDADSCQYPGDPRIDLVGSQTIFALDANHCLILTHLEYAEHPQTAALMSRRTNARFRGATIARADALIRGRHLSEADVRAVNFVLKSRARKYVAAADPAWLYPEGSCDRPWPDLASVLLPEQGLWKFGGEIYIGYEDGRTAYFDAYGRTSKAHEHLSKPVLKEAPEPNAACRCGSGWMFADCCKDVPVHERPAWTVLSIRERNLALARGIRQVLEYTADTTWDDMRRKLSDDHVRKIHELVASLWPIDTRLDELLPRPQGKRSRGLYLGVADPRTVSVAVTGLLPYADELVLVLPFINPIGMRPEFSPIDHPEKFHEQTLRSVFLLMLLEPAIRVGRVHLVPDPMDFDFAYRDEIMASADRHRGDIQIGPADKLRVEAMGFDEVMRAIKRLPHDDMIAYLRQVTEKAALSYGDDDLTSVAQEWKRDLEEDPIAPLVPVPRSPDKSEIRTFKGFSRETGLFIAALTGSFIYTDSDTHWMWLHRGDGVHAYSAEPRFDEAVHSLASFYIEIPTATYYHAIEPVGAQVTASALRDVFTAAAAGLSPNLTTSADVAADEVPPSNGSLRFHLRASVPVGGFTNLDVTRLFLTFGRMDAVAPVRLAVYLDRAVVT